MTATDVRTSAAPDGARPPLREAPSWDLVLKRNFVERLKRDKFPLEIRDELPRLIEEGYERISEEDVVRLQWWGLYHDKPKVGTFMMRIKIAGGVLAPVQVRAIGEIADRYGKGYGELSTRQNIQLHHLELKHLPDVFATLERNGLSTARNCSMPRSRCARRLSSSTATANTATCPASTRSPSPAAPTSATYRRCTASR